MLEAWLFTPSKPVVPAAASVPAAAALDAAMAPAVVQFDAVAAKAG